ncbi:MAG: DUF883 family protein, partial [Ignavibacteriales bacterium]
MTEYELQEFEALKADVAKLRSDLFDLTEDLTDIGKEGAGTPKEELDRQVKNLKQKLGQILKDTREMGKRRFETIQEQIEDRDQMSLLVASGAGFLLGLLITWIIKG